MGAAARVATACAIVVLVTTSLEASPSGHVRAAANDDRIGAPLWPQAGSSFVTYHVEIGGGAPGYITNDAINVTLFYNTAAFWEVHCETTRTSNNNGNQTTTFYRETNTFLPPKAPTTVTVGDTVDVGTIGRCVPDLFDNDVDGTRTVSTQRNGQPVTVESWYGGSTCSCDFDWARHQGLTLQWAVAGATFHSAGRLVDTDAPI